MEEANDSRPDIAHGTLFRRLRLSLAVTVLINILLISITYSNAGWIVDTYENRGDAINSLERARALAAKVVLIARQAKGTESPQTRWIRGVELTRAAADLKAELASHDALVFGQGFDSATLDRLRNGPDGFLDTDLAKFLALTTQLEQAVIRGEPGRLPQQIAQLQRTKLDAGILALEGVHQTAVKVKVLRLKALMVLLGLLALVAFMLQWFWSYKPLGESIAAGSRDLMKANRRITHALLYDSLTGLPNRRHLLDHLAAHMPVGSPLGVLTLDLLRFREVNDTLGSHVGDEILRIVSKALSTKQHSDEFIARIGSNTFVLATSVRHAASQLEAIAAEVTEELSRSFEVDGHKISLNLAIGLATSESYAETVSSDTLLADCEIALTRAKLEQGTVLFLSVMRAELQARRHTASELLTAFEEDQIEPFFQPQVSAQTGALLGFEALARWQHPDRGWLTPIHFLEIAKAANLGPKLSEVITRKSLYALAEWRRAASMSARSG